MKSVRLLLVLLAAAAVTWLALSLRFHAARSLPVDHDERSYLPVAWYYGRSIQKGWLENIPRLTEGHESPIFAKLVYGAFLARRPPLPVIEKIDIPILVRMPNSPARSLLYDCRFLSAGFGALTAGLMALLNPLAGLFLAVHTFAIKYTSVVYLESIPSFTSLAAVLAYTLTMPGYRSRLPGFIAARLPSPALFAGLSAVFIGLTVASKYTYGVAAIALTAHQVWNAIRSRSQLVPSLRTLAVWSGLAALVFFAADPYLWPDPFGRLLLSLRFNADFSNNAYVASFGYPFWQPLVWLSKPVTQHPFDVIPTLPGNFLFLWTTRWPHYVLVLLAPLSLSAAEGVATLIAPLRQLIQKGARIKPPGQPGHI